MLDLESEPGWGGGVRWMWNHFCSFTWGSPHSWGATGSFFTKLTDFLGVSKKKTQESPFPRKKPAPLASPSGRPWGRGSTATLPFPSLLPLPASTHPAGWGSFAPVTGWCAGPASLLWS